MPDERTSDVIRRAAECLARASRPRAPDPRWEEAVARVRAGDGEGAATALSGLDDAVRLVATQVLERLAVALDHDEAVLRAIGELVRASTGKGPALDPIGWQWSRAYDAEVPPRLGLEQLKGAAPHGYDATRRLARACEAALARGDLDAAITSASAIHPYHKEATGLAWCAIAAAQPPGRDADASWDRAVKAARRPPMIQDGAEEAEGLAAVLDRMVDRLPHDHPAITSAIGALLRMGEVRAPKDARGTGIARAAQHCARRAVAVALSEAAAAWIAHAEALLGCQIDGGAVAYAAWIRLAAARRARGETVEEDAALGRIGDKVFAVPAVRAAYPDRAERLVAYWNVNASAFGEVRLIREFGGDASDRLDAAVRGTCAYAGGAERAFGELIAIAHAEAPRAPWSDDPRGPIEARAYALWSGKIKDRAVARYEAAHSLLWVDEEAARAWFVAALDLGYREMWLANDPRLLPDEAVRERVAAIATANPDLSDRSRVLTDLAALWWSEGQVDRALGVIGRLSSRPPRDEQPVWTPLAERTDGGGWAPRAAVVEDRAAPVPGAMDAGRKAIRALKASERRDAWWDLAGRVDDPDELREIRDQIAKGKEKGHLAALRWGRLARLDLRLSEPDAAITSASNIDGRRSGIDGRAGTAERIGAWLLARPEVLEPPRVLGVLGLFTSATPQLREEHAIPVVPDLIARLPVNARPPALDAVRAWGPIGHAAEAIVLGREGVAAGAAQALGRALAAPGTGGGRRLALALFAAERGGPLPGRRELLEACLRRTTGYRYQVVGAIEEIACAAWENDDTDSVPSLLARTLASEDADFARRSLVVLAPSRARRAVDAVLAAWADEAPNVDQAREQVEALARALAREGRPEADEVRALLA